MKLSPKPGLTIAFVLVILVMSLYYNYQDILFYRPMSVHSWRQTDCASIALNYYQRDMNFFHPEVCSHLYQNRGYAVAELPWIYYLAALMYKVFGFHEYFFRGIVLAIFYCGLFALFRLSFLVLQDGFFSIAVPVFLFTCPIPVYYANNFLPNVPALSLEIIAFYFFVRYLYDPRLKFFILSLIFFLVTGLTKISSLFTFATVIALFGMQVIGLSKWYSKVKIFRQPLVAWIGLSLVILLLVGWYSWAAWFNTVHHNGLFLIGILPMWDMPHDQVKSTFDKIHDFFTDYFFYRSFIWIFLSMPLLILFNTKKIGRIWIWILLFMGIGFAAYCVLFFQTFFVHEYYFICLYSSVVLLLLVFFLMLQQRFPDLFKSVEFRILIAFGLLLSTSHCKDILSNSYYGWRKDDGTNPAFYDPKFIEELRAHGVAPQTMVLMDADFTPNKTLYLTNLQGWTEFGWNPPYSISIEDFCKWGIKYIIVDDKDCMTKDRYNYIKDHLLFQYNGIFVFSVPGAT